MPAGAKILPLRSNIPAISQHCFTVCDEAFPSRAKEMGQSIIVGGSNYGQGSSVNTLHWHRCIWASRQFW
mgnify:CR=1 FL=1